jgi:hypothetical protein
MMARLCNDRESKLSPPVTTLHKWIEAQNQKILNDIPATVVSGDVAPTEFCVVPPSIISTIRNAYEASLMPYFTVDEAISLIDNAWEDLKKSGNTYIARLPLTHYATVIREAKRYECIKTGSLAKLENREKAKRAASTASVCAAHPTPINDAIMDFCRQ